MRRNVRDNVVSHVADPAANAGATQLDKVKVDIAAGKTATDANNTAIDAILVALEKAGIVAKA